MKTLKSTGTLVIALIFFAIACTKSPSQFFDIPSNIIFGFDQELFLKAIDHQKKGQIKPAMVLWKKFLQKYPNSFEARNNLSLLYYASDEITKAIYQLDLALKLKPSSGRIKKNLSRALKIQVAIYDENKEYDYAIKYFKENNPIINLGFGLMTPETVQQYQREERSLMANRVKSSQGQINELIATMKMDPIAPIENVKSLGKELSAFYEDENFLKCSSMGSLIERSLLMLFIKPDLYKER